MRWPPCATHCSASPRRPAPTFVLVNVQSLPSLYEVVVAHDAERLDAVRRAAGSDLLGAAEALLDAAGADWTRARSPAAARNT